MSGFWQETPGLSPHRVKRHLRLIQLGLLNELRNPGLRRPAIAAALAAGGVAWLLRDVPGFAWLTLSEWLGRLYGLGAAVWMIAFAARDLEGGTRAGLIMRSKPADGGVSVLLHWTIGLILWGVLLGIAFVPTLGVLLATSGLAAGPALLPGLGGAALAVATLATLTFAATRAFQHRAAGGLLVLAWIALAQPLARMHLSPEYSPNAVAWGGLALIALTLAALVVERRRRDEPVRPAVTAALLALCCVPIAARAAAAFRPAASALSRPDLNDETRLQPLSLQQSVPGLGVPDSRGRLIRTADYPGKILFIYLFPARDAHSLRALNALRGLHRELGVEGVQPLAVAVDTDPGKGALAVPGAGFGFPIGFDPSAAGASRPAEAAIARAFGAHSLPLLVVTDRRRAVAEIRYDRHWTVEALRKIARARLTEEPR